jgi:hypothetical protein
MGWKPISKIAVQFVAAVVVPTALAVLNAVDVTNIDWKYIGTIAGSAATTALIGYLKSFSGNEVYIRYQTPQRQ